MKGGAEGVSAIYLDIDGFIGVNEAFGHLEGDRILVELARWLAGKATTLGVEVFRIGGNEFVLVGAALPNARTRELAEGFATPFFSERGRLPGSRRGPRGLPERDRTAS